MKSSAERLRALARSPMTWILFAILLLHAVGIGWGLPASDGWDNDGVAPRDVWPGLALTFTPGKFYTYPPVHLALLAIVTLPITLVGVARASSLALHDVVSEMLKTPYMTGVAYVARSVSVLMSLGIVVFCARIAEELLASELAVATEDPRVRRVGWCTAAFVGMNASFTYYAHTSNLDVPYLFWATWSLLWFVRAVTRDDPRQLRKAFGLAVLAIATKDQASAMFLAAYPAALALWRPAKLREVVIASAMAIALLLVADAVVFNPSGFLERVHFLTGAASKDYVEYTRDWPGRIKILADASRFFDLQYPYFAVPLVVLGAAQTLGRARRLAVALLPLLVLVSFTVLFNWMSLRTNARFLLPQALMLGLYGGRGVASLLFAARRDVRVLASVLVAFPVFAAARACVSVDANLLLDPRYEAEAWLREHVAPGETIETYGLNVYLPRFPADARVTRVGPEPIAGRSPLPGVTEVEDAYENAPGRRARWIVLCVGWGWRYFPWHPALTAGTTIAPTQERNASDVSATRWFTNLNDGKEAFVLAHEAKYERERDFPIVDVHGTTGRPIWIYRAR